MSETKNRFKTIIQGKTYVIVGTKPQAHMKVASELVEEQLNQLKELTVGLDGERRAILMAVNAVSAQMDLQAQVEELQEEKRQLEKLTASFDDSVRSKSGSEDV